MDYSPQAFSVHGISRARILEQVVFPSPGDLPNPRIEPISLMSPALTDGFFVASTTWEAYKNTVRITVKISSDFIVKLKINTYINKILNKPQMFTPICHIFTQAPFKMKNIRFFFSKCDIEKHLSLFSCTNSFRAS